MTEKMKKYDVARHRHIGGMDLLVLESDEKETSVRYFSNGVYYTHTFNTDELTVKTPSKGMGLSALSTIG